MLSSPLRMRLALVAGLLLAFHGAASAQDGALGGTIREADNTIPTSSALSISVFPLEDTTNLVTFPGRVRYQDGTYVARFNQFPRPISAGQTLRVTAVSSATGGEASLDVRILDNDASHVGNLVLRVLAPAAIRLTRVLAPQRVARGDSGVVVTVEATNDGDRTGSLEGAALLLIPQSYSVSAAPANPTTLGAGRTALLSFSVSVSSTAPLGPTTVDARIDADPDGASQKASWIVEEPAILRVLAVQPSRSVFAGEPGIPVRVTVTNAGQRAGALSGASLVFSRSGDFQAAPLPSNPTSLAAGGTTTLFFSVNVSPVASLGPVTVDARLDGDPDGAEQPASWLVLSPNLCPIANGGASQTFVVTAPAVDLEVSLSGRRSSDPDRPTSDPAIPTLTFAWSLSQVLSDAGTPLQTSFSSTEIEPVVRLARAGLYRFALVVTEAGPPGPFNSGCSSQPDFVDIRVRHLPAGGQSAPGAIARLDEREESSVLTLPVTSAVRLTALPPESGRFDDQTPGEALTFQWQREPSLRFGPDPAATIVNAASQKATVLPTAPGAYRFTVSVTDDGRSSPSGPSSDSDRLRSFQSNPVELLVRPPDDTFPVLTTLRALTASGGPVTFSTPAVIPATASIFGGGFPVIRLVADAIDAQTPTSGLTFTWTPLTDPAVPVTIDRGPGTESRFTPPAGASYMFQVVVSDGVLEARARLSVPVDDLRPGGIIGVTPSINGQTASADSIDLGPIATGTVVLDAAASQDRSVLYGRSASALAFSWTQLSGPEVLVFPATASRLTLRPPPGEYQFLLQVSNAAGGSGRQLVSFVIPAAASTAPAFPSTNGGCALGHPAPISGLWPLAGVLLWLRRARRGPLP